MLQEQKEKLILRISFFAGLFSVIVEFIFALYSYSQSTLTDAVYDASDLLFVALILFLTPLFHKPISEKHPFGYFQVETIFLIVKGVMILSVTACVAMEVIDSVFSGGHSVDGRQVSIFQLCLGMVNILVYTVMKRLSRSVSSPTVHADVLGWKLDIAYSFGLSLAFFVSVFLIKTPLAFLAPYFDQLITIVVMLLMLPESIKMLLSAMKDVFLFSPDDQALKQIKALCMPILNRYGFKPVFFDVTKTGRHLWIAVYFEISGGYLNMADLKNATQDAEKSMEDYFENVTCELIAVSEETYVQNAVETR